MEMVKWFYAKNSAREGHVRIYTTSYRSEPNSPKKVTFEWVLLGHHIIGLFFLHENLTGERFLQLLQEEMAAAMSEVARDDQEIWFQMDDCPAYLTAMIGDEYNPSEDELDPSSEETATEEGEDSNCDSEERQDEHKENYEPAFSMRRCDRQNAEKNTNMLYLTVDLQQTNAFTKANNIKKNRSRGEITSALNIQKMKKKSGICIGKKQRDQENENRREEEKSVEKRRRIQDDFDYKLENNGQNQEYKEEKQLLL
ncbi:hypothetical protein ILUMI_07354 [Ignelater luminosus]|uniref:Uncharacterized protein n=1 Tax=Ignelater luminosus TaxID=2038154 RepID=A0A8K0D3M0_IGNLU|nr:hypothetical protein ILUMI_07354 [Ignelater luminosus]